jgi:ADP-ribose pyrophosphatase YjhB (NUDIX family)
MAKEAKAADNSKETKGAKEPEEVSETHKIFRTLMHFPGSSFSDLWDKSIPSNKFTYYLKKMEQEGLVEKKDSKYFLTTKGKSEATTVDGNLGKNVKRPYVALLLVPRREGKYILYHRMKEPYYGNCGFPGAKMDAGEEILESAERELKEETGLEGKGKIVTIQNILTINNGEVFGHMTQFVVLFNEPRGELVRENREGTYEWAAKEQILSQKNLFPDVPGAIKDIEEKNFCIKEVKLIQKDEKFIGIESRNIAKWKL